MFLLSSTFNVISIQSKVVVSVKSKKWLMKTHYLKLNWCSLPHDPTGSALKLHYQLNLQHALLTLFPFNQLVMLCCFLWKWMTQAIKTILSQKSWHQSIWEVVCGSIYTSGPQQAAPSCIQPAGLLFVAPELLFLHYVFSLLGQYMWTWDLSPCQRYTDSWVTHCCKCNF